MNESNRPGSRRAGATPNRGGSRTPPLIEGEARDVTAEGLAPGDAADQEAQSIAAGPLPGHEAEVQGTPEGAPTPTPDTPEAATTAEPAGAPPPSPEKPSCSPAASKP